MINLKHHPRSLLIAAFGLFLIVVGLWFMPATAAQEDSEATPEATLEAAATESPEESAEPPAQLPTEGEGNWGYCLLCHTDTDLTQTHPDGTVFDFTVTPDDLLNSVHGLEVGCADCHTDDTFPHDNIMTQEVMVINFDEVAGCAECHDEAAQELAEGTHATGRIEAGISADLGVSCSDCHGAHEVHPVEDMTCASCHLGEVAWNEILTENEVGPLTLNLGLGTCADCHETTVAEWEASAHGDQQLACDTCHLPHQGKLRFETSTQLCLNCHDQDRTSFTHVTHLEQACVDCHYFDAASSTQVHVATGAIMPTGHETEVGIGACVDCHGGEVGTSEITVAQVPPDETTDPTAIETEGTAEPDEEGDAGADGPDSETNSGSPGENEDDKLDEIADIDDTGNPVTQAQEQLESLEQQLEETRDEGADTASVRLVQGVIVGLAIGVILAVFGLRYMRYRSERAL